MGLAAVGCQTTKSQEEIEQDALYASLPYKVPENSWTIKRCPVAIECTEIKQVDANTSTTNTVIKTLPYAEYTPLGVLGNVCSCVRTELGFTVAKIKTDLESVATEAENHPLKENAAYKFTQGFGDGICWVANVGRFTAIELVKGVLDGVVLGFTTDVYSEREKASINYLRKNYYNTYQLERKGLDDYCAIDRVVYTDTDGKVLKFEASDPYSELSKRQRKDKMKALYQENTEKGKQRYEAWTSEGTGSAAPTTQQGNTPDKSQKTKSENQPDVSFMEINRINRVRNMAVAQTAHRQLLRTRC